MKKLTGAEIRQSFIDFFVAHGHTAVPSSPLVPGGDATLLFTNSGMVQFKDVFLGQDKRPYTRAVDSQKCLRVAGKHNDLDEVGRDDTHHTFFEMLGNWSFGDYYKKEAISWAWELLTGVWGLEKDRLWATCFEGEKHVSADEEAAGHWRAQPGFLHDHVQFFGRKDNFWEMAETGPCGPCSEIHYDRGAQYCDKSDVPGHVCRVNGDCTRFLELWNLVFMQYNRLGPDSLEPLPATHVDTGMGFERIVSVLQDVRSNYQTDLFANTLEVLRGLTGHTEKQMLADFTPYRVIADHARSAAFLIADGVVPGNVGRNYICRMIIRRAARFGGKLGLRDPFLAKVADAIISTYGDFYTELQKHRAAILDNLTREEVRFQRTVEAGTAQLENSLQALRSTGRRVLDGRQAFDLYATYGLPLEIARDIAREQGLDVAEPEFRAAMEEHRLASGGGKAMGKMGGEDAEFFTTLRSELQKASRLGKDGVEYDPYTLGESGGDILAIVMGADTVKTSAFGDAVEVVLPKTGFYIESGGQVGDTGTIHSAKRTAQGLWEWEIEITRVRRAAPGMIVHSGEVVSGHPKVGDAAVAAIDSARRHDIMRNHTATHLLHAALHQVLGEHARQAGSLVAPDRLRFDFNNPDAMTSAQLERVEAIVNEAVAADMEVLPRLKSREDAIEEGAMALFGEKYGDTVRTITIVPAADGAPAMHGAPEAHPMASAEHQHKFSYELCGGTHISRTSDVGAFLIISEGSAAAGVRRIEAVTGRGAYAHTVQRGKLLRMAANNLKSSIEEIPQRLESLQAEVSDLRHQVAELRRAHALDHFEQALAGARQVRGVTALAVELKGAEVDTLRTLADRFREVYSKSAVALLVSGTVVLAVATEDLVKQGIKAGDLIGMVGGKGGGRPNLAQGSVASGGTLADLATAFRAGLEERLK